MKTCQVSKLDNLPSAPGIYVFKDSQGNILYIGKATNIKKRVKGHFQKPSFHEACFEFLKEVRAIGYEVTNSEIEALLLEAALIRKHKPQYNVMWKDDKNYFYVGITQETYPRVLLTHQPHSIQKLKMKNKKLKTTIKNLKVKQLSVRYVGPFVDGKALKTTLKILRRIFPYRMCGKLPHRTCMWFEIHKKEAPCTGTIDPKEYEQNIQHLAAILEGEKQSVLRKLQTSMKQASGNQQFERAADIKDQIAALRNVFEHARILTESERVSPHVALRELKQLLNLEKEPKRIEGYDISNIQGKEATGSMVVFRDGEPAKDQYRKFKIKIAGIPNDIAMLKEMIARRIAHQEWPRPDLILVDGGVAQLRAVRAALGREGYKRKFAIIALAKRRNLLYTEYEKRPVSLRTLPQASRNLLLHIRDESHRFAISYHRKLHRASVLCL